MRMTTLLALALGFAIGLTCQSAEAGEAYRYTTADGVLSFADDLDHVPLRYQADAKLVELAELGTYTRLTITSPSRPNQARIARLRKEHAVAAEWAQRHRILRAQRADAITFPIHATREMHWVEGVLGYSGKRYVAVDVLRDANGRILSTGLSEIGLPRMP